MRVKLISLLILIIFVSTNEDYYRLLEVEKTSSTIEIKKAFKKLALKYHPDKNPDNKEWANEEFRKIANAYEILSNPEKRKHYDQFGVSEDQETTNTKNYNFEDFFGNLFDPFQGIFNFNINFDDDDEDQQGEQEDHNAQPPNFLNSYVIEINISNFSLLFKNKDFTMVLFYSHKLFKEDNEAIIPKWKELSKKSFRLFKVAIVNCAFSEEICNDLNIESLPNIFYNGSKTKQKLSIYQGKVNLSSIIKFAMKKMKLKVKKVSVSQLKSFLSNKLNVTKIVIFYQKSISKKIFNILKKFTTNFIFGKIDCRKETKSSLLNFGLKSIPSLLIFKGEEFMIKFELKDISSLESFLDKVITSEKIVDNLIELDYELYNEKKYCNNDKNYCAILLLNEDKSNETHKSKAVIIELMQKFKTYPIKFFFINIKKYSEIKTLFESYGVAENNLIMIKSKNFSFFNQEIDYSELSYFIYRSLNRGNKIQILKSEMLFIPRRDISDL